jgi:transcriptional regulator with XRE-family HTH domain
MVSVAVGNQAAGHPTVDEIYEKLLREQFKKSALDDTFVKGVVQRFRKAPLARCSKSIGRWINRKLREAGWTQQQLAERLGVDRSAVSYWLQGGNITLDNLAQVLIEFQAEWSELPIPARQELAMAAYLAALEYIQQRLHPDQGRCQLDRECFWCLFHLFSEPFWEQAVRRQDPELLRKEADRVVAASRCSLGAEPRHIVHVEGLRQLVREWGVAWLVCIAQAPSRWAVT